MRTAKALWVLDSKGCLSLRWAHRSFCWFCHAVAHLFSCICGFVILWLIYSLVSRWFCCAVAHLFSCISVVLLCCGLFILLYLCGFVVLWLIYSLVSMWFCHAVAHLFSCIYVVLLCCGSFIFWYLFGFVVLWLKCKRSFNMSHAWFAKLKELDWKTVSFWSPLFGIFYLTCAKSRSVMSYYKWNIKGYKFGRILSLQKFSILNLVLLVALQSTFPNCSQNIR